MPNTVCKPATTPPQEALERAALVPAALRAALCALQPAAGTEAGLQPAHWRAVAAGLTRGPRAALLLDALWDATATVYAMARTPAATAPPHCFPGERAWRHASLRHELNECGCEYCRLLHTALRCLRRALHLWMFTVHMAFMRQR